MDKGTYGFGRADAEALANLIGSVEVETPRRPLRTVKGSKFVRFQLNEDLTTTTAGADILDADGNTIEEDATIEDPEEIFTGLTDGTRGIGMADAGRYFILNANCPVEPEE